MKISKIFFSLFLINSILFGSSIINPSSPILINEGILIPDTKNFDLRLGAEYLNTFDLVMKFPQKYRSFNFCHPRIKSNSISAILEYTLKERASIYTKFGQQNISSNFFINNNYYKILGKPNLYYLIGAKISLIEFLDFSFGVDGKYYYFKSNIEKTQQNDFIISSNNSYQKYYGYQIAVSIADKISIFCPYLGLVFSDKRYKLKKTSFYSSRIRLRPKKKVGFFLGTSITNGSFFMLNLEGHFINEKAFSISGILRI
jgi:hypothetical protein